MWLQQGEATPYERTWYLLNVQTTEKMTSSERIDQRENQEYRPNIVLFAGQ